MPDSPTGWSLPAKITLASAAAVLLSFGLCAVGGGFMAQDHVLLNETGVLLFFGGLLGLVFGVVFWIIQAIFNHRKRGQAP